jgi:regulatory protein
MRKPVEKSLRSRALEALSRREHSRTELARKLASHTDNPDELHALLDDLQARGWLSDAHYTEQVIHARQARYGSRKIAYELREQGIDDSLITAHLAGLKDTELERARGVWEKKFGQPPTTEQEKAKQIRFLQSRGFGWEVIVRVIAGGGASR